jgi:hypothetical protein
MPTDLPSPPPPPLVWRIVFWLMCWRVHRYRLWLYWTTRKAERIVARWERRDRHDP